MNTKRAPEVLRLKIKSLAETQGIFDNKVPSRTYCAITIQAMAEFLGISITNLTQVIERYPYKNQGKDNE